MLKDRGLILKKGTIVDSTLISAPSSTKNRKKQRDPEAHQTKKGNNWYFGYKAHIGVDRDSGLVHTLKGTDANVHDATQMSELLVGEEEEVFGDSGYLGAEKREDAVLKKIPTCKRCLLGFAFTKLVSVSKTFWLFKCKIYDFLHFL